MREIRTVSQLSLRHPRILPFLGTVNVRKQKALVSLYMKNGNLIEYLRLHAGCNKKKLILQVAEGINHLHVGVRLVHGDLKCANVLISDVGDALLADFGLSTFVDKSTYTLTTATSIRNMHTARFAAPELLIGEDERTVRPRSKTRESDVYAFGMLILEVRLVAV
ncbi:kinase-like protein, partial [Auricularia subglabra TFB-10046 SS5]